MFDITQALRHRHLTRKRLGAVESGIPTARSAESGGRSTQRANHGSPEAQKPRSQSGERLAAGGVEALGENPVTIEAGFVLPRPRYTRHLCRPHAGYEKERA